MTGSRMTRRVVVPSIRRQGASKPAGILRKNIYLVLAVLAISGAAGFIAPLFVSSAVYGVPWRNSDDSLARVSERGAPQVTPTWAKPGIPQVRVNFWITSTAGFGTAALEALTPTPTPTSTLATPTQASPTWTRRPKNEPTSTRKPKEPTSTPRPPKPTATQAPTRPPTLPPPSETPLGGSGAAVNATPTPMPGGADPHGHAYASMQGGAAGAPQMGFLQQAAAGLWSLLRALWQ